MSVAYEDFYADVVRAYEVLRDAEARAEYEHILRVGVAMHVQYQAYAAKHPQHALVHVVVVTFVLLTALNYWYGWYNYHRYQRLAKRTKAYREKSPLFYMIAHLY